MADGRLFRDQTAARVAILEGLGYQVAFREDGFVSCAVWGPDRWHGVGPTRAIALSDALSKMFPSRASARMLAGFVDALEAEQAPPPLGPDEDVRVLLAERDADVPAAGFASEERPLDHGGAAPVVLAALPFVEQAAAVSMEVPHEAAPSLRLVSPAASAGPTDDDARRAAERRLVEEQAMRSSRAACTTSRGP